MFYIAYMFSELRRRSGRTVLTALGLAVGVGLVVTVTALSDGLDKAQSEVLEPLTGVGTDMTVTRPLQASGSGEEQSFGPDGGAGLSEREQQRLREENGPPRLGLRNLGEPGEKFTNTNFVTSELSLPERELRQIDSIEGVSGAAPALTLNIIQASGTVPEQTGAQTFGAPAGGGGPDSINIEQSSVAGVDATQPELGPLTASQVSGGSYFSADGKREAIVGEGYAKREQLELGDQLELDQRSFEIVGIASPPLGGQSSDVYLKLEELQRLADREGRINLIAVRAAQSDDVGAISKQIESSIAGAEVTTSEDLADRVSGSLVDAKDLSGKLGAALALVALVAAFLIASLLTLASVNKRVRELGTLKAVGWSQRLVVRQVTGESVLQGALGGAVGAVLGIGGAALITAFGPTLEASFGASQPQAPAGPGGGLIGGPGGGPFGQGQVESGTSAVSLTAPIDPALIVLAIGLAVLGGLIAGAIGGMRAARLRPAEALRSVE